VEGGVAAALLHSVHDSVSVVVHDTTVVRDTLVRVAEPFQTGSTLRNVLIGAGIGFVGALAAQVFQRWLRRRALRRSLIKAVRTDLLYTVYIFEELAKQAKDPSGFQQQLLSMLDGYTDHYREYRRDLGLFHERVRKRLHYVFSSIHAWRDVQRLILQREDLLNAKGVPADEKQSMRDMAAPLHEASKHALEAVADEYGRVFRFMPPQADNDPAPPGIPRKPWADRRRTP
jgi:hypothetical protein